MTSRGSDNAVRLEFRCQDVGIACKQITQAETADDLVKAVAAHARAEHGVELNATLIDYALTKVRPTGG